MALTELEKAQNKAASEVRRKAHTARRKLYRQALDAVESDPEVVAVRQTADAADEHFNRLHDQRRRRIEDLQSQVSELQDQIRQLERGDEASTQAQADRRSTYDLWRALKARKEQEIYERFPDMKGGAECHTGLWQPPADVQAAMDVARSNATVDILKPKSARKVDPVRA